VGGGAHFEVTAFGTGLGYQWQRSTDGGITWFDIHDGAGLDGCTAPYLKVKNISQGASGDQFRCVVTGNISSEASRPATLTVIEQYPLAAFGLVQDKDSVHFQNLSGNYDFFQWHFGNGDSTLLDSPAILYTHAGTYPAMLIATNACGQDTFVQDIVIPELVAEYSADRTHGCAPLTVHFQSDVPYRVSNQKYLTPGSSAPVAWANNGQHTVSYNTPGVFDATLMAFTPQAVEKDTVKKLGYITVEAGINPVADISALLSGNEVQLSSSFNFADTYTWFLSNGDTLSGQDVAYNFNSEGVYTVMLQTANHCGTALDTVVLVVGDPGAAFAHGGTSGCGPVAVQFQDTSPFVADSLQWFFPGGNPAASSAESPISAYTGSGSYSAAMVAYVGGLADTVTQQFTVEVLQDECPIPQIFTQVEGLGVTAWTDCPAGSGLTWDMGDGSQFNSQGITYQYGSAGSYTVVLTVTGQCGGTYGASATVSVTGPSATGAPIGPKAAFSVFPNPAHGQVFFASQSPVPGRVGIRLLSATGVPVAVLARQDWRGTAAVPLGGLPPGLYFYEVNADGLPLQQGKLVVAE
jgi:PKD repeat protein